MRGDSFSHVASVADHVRVILAQRRERVQIDLERFWGEVVLGIALAALQEVYGLCDPIRLWYEHRTVLERALAERERAGIVACRVLSAVRHGQE